MRNRFKKPKKEMIECIIYLKKLQFRDRLTDTYIGWWCQIRYKNKENIFAYELDTVDDIDVDNIKDMVIYSGSKTNRYYLNEGLRDYHIRMCGNKTLYAGLIKEF